MIIVQFQTYIIRSTLQSNVSYKIVRHDNFLSVYMTTDRNSSLFITFDNTFVSGIEIGNFQFLYRYRKRDISLSLKKSGLETARFSLTALFLLISKTELLAFRFHLNVFSYSKNTSLFSEKCKLVIRITMDKCQSSKDMRQVLHGIGHFS